MDEKKNNSLLALIGSGDDICRYLSNDKIQDILTDELRERDEKYDKLLKNVKDEDLKYKTILEDLRNREQDIFMFRAFACGAYNNRPVGYYSSKLYLDDLDMSGYKNKNVDKIDKSVPNDTKKKKFEGDADRFVGNNQKTNKIEGDVENIDHSTNNNNYPSTKNNNYPSTKNNKDPSDDISMKTIVN